MVKWKPEKEWIVVLLLPVGLGVAAAVFISLWFASPALFAAAAGLFFAAGVLIFVKKQGK